MHLKLLTAITGKLAAFMPPHADGARPVDEHAQSLTLTVGVCA